jgi:hypothetical protein
VSGQLQSPAPLPPVPHVSGQVFIWTFFLFWYVELVPKFVRTLQVHSVYGEQWPFLCPRISSTKLLEGMELYIYLYGAHVTTLPETLTMTMNTELGGMSEEMIAVYTSTFLEGLRKTATGIRTKHFLNTSQKRHRVC